MTDSSLDRGWERTRSLPGPELILFRTRYDWYTNPRNGKQFQRVVLQAPDWVNVIAVTPTNEFIMVRQFRFGVARETTEIPAGMVEPGEPPEEAAKRELEEETGYTSDRWTLLGSVEPNPAFLDNHCYTYLAQNVVRNHAPSPDEGEDILVEELEEAEIREGIRTGRIRNALAVVALGHVLDLRGAW